MFTIERNPQTFKGIVHPSAEHRDSSVGPVTFSFLERILESHGRKESVYHHTIVELSPQVWKIRQRKFVTKQQGKKRVFGKISSVTPELEPR